MSANPSRRDPQQAAKPPAEPYNAGDEEKVAERQKSAKRRDDQVVDGLRYVMGSPRGRAWMRHLLAEKLFTRVGSSRPPGMFTGNSTTFYNSALREIGDLLAAELNAHCRPEFRMMEEEGEANA